MKRGIKQSSSFGGVVVLKGHTHTGALAFRLEADASAFRATWLAHLEAMLDEIDPPLRLVSGDHEPE